MNDRFNLSCSLTGHRQDVKGISPLYYPIGAIVTVSRDVTSRIWTPNEYSPIYLEGMEMGGHENFVNSVCVLPPDSEYTQGLIITGGNDNNILAYTIDSPAPIFKLSGHTKAVCALASGKFGMFASGSWDHTARIWNKQSHIMTLIGHEAAVCCVAILPGNRQVLTGSADKTLRLWNNGKVIHIFSGHTDCVRGIAVISPNRFLSCSNDTTVRLWEFNGSCLQTFFGHTNYVYSIACLGPNLEFATSGEDKSLRIWRGGECVQTILHPTQSVWSVCALPNGDIATGGSDGIVRIFTQDQSRTADLLTLLRFEESAAQSYTPAQTGDIKNEDLLGPEALYIPGRKEGEVVMVKRNNTVEVHQWSQLQGKWINIGDVVDDSSASDGKTHKGKKYDYVFDVSLNEGQPPSKLTYNRNESPYTAAQRFIQENNLSPLFVEEIVSLIKEQVGTTTIGANASSVATGNKQISESKLSNSFGSKSSVTVTKPEGGYFPEKEFLKFENINVNGILGKLGEFMNKVQNEKIELDKIKSILEKKQNPYETCRIMLNLLNWPSEFLFPVLDILKYTLLDSACFNAFIALKDPLEIVHSFCILISQSDIKNQILSLKTLCNIFKHEAGQKFILDNLDILLKNIDGLKAVNDKNLQVSLSSFLVNVSVLTSQSNNDSLKCSILTIIAHTFSQCTDGEAAFRYAVALGTLATNNELCVAVLHSLSIDDSLKSYLSKQNSAPEKLQKCIKSLLSLLN